LREIALDKIFYFLTTPQSHPVYSDPWNFQKDHLGHQKENENTF